MTNIFVGNDNVSYFDTIDEYINYLEVCENKHDCWSSKEGSYDFCGTHSFKEAIDLCKYGDEDLINYIKSLEDVDKDNLEFVDKNRKNYTNEFVGFTPNVPNYVLGVPKDMIHDNSIKIKSKIINIFINLSASCYVNKEDIKKQAVNFVKAIDGLEKKGYRCNVYVGNMASKYSSWSGKEYYAIIVKIKGDREPLNLAKMAFPLCHPSMLRRLGFRWIESLPINFTNDGYGKPLEHDSDGDEQVVRLLKMVFSGMKINVLPITSKNSAKDVVEKIEKNIEK